MRSLILGLILTAVAAFTAGVELVGIAQRPAPAEHDGDSKAESHPRGAGDLSQHSNLVICEEGLNYSRDDWNLLRNEDAVAEAKRRNLSVGDCRVALGLPASAVAAQKTDQSAITAAAHTTHRVALVIGNSAYASVSPLKNPRNDAELVAKTLRSLGFEVTELVDADYNAMRQAIIDFGRALRSGSDASLFYYSGHGIQVAGHNYLVPVDAALKSEQEAAVETLDVESYLGAMQDSGSRINIVVLDACRNNPFATVFRAASRGLSMVRAPSETFIGYSTAPGDVADDGDGPNSPFTLALVNAISQPGVEIGEVFKKVRRKVMDETKGRQVPWDSSSITEDFYFVPSPATNVPQPIRVIHPVLKPQG